LITFMKRTLCFSLLGFALSTSTIIAASPAIPERQPSDRYEKMTEDWPFSVATPTAPAPEKVDGWWTNFYVAGVGKHSDEKGNVEDMVGISSKDKTVSFTLFGNEKGRDDISIAGVEWNDNVGKGKVTLKKGSEFGTIEFDQMALKTPAPAAAPPVRPGGVPAAGAANANAGRNQMRPPTFNAAPATSVVPRPTAVQPQLPQAVPKLPQAAPNAAVQPNQSADQAGGRPRVRVIKSNP